MVPQIRGTETWSELKLHCGKSEPRCNDASKAKLGRSRTEATLKPLKGTGVSEDEVSEGQRKESWRIRYKM